jgi:hypothetical protein
MATTTIRFLDTQKTISVETPVRVSTGWGDRDPGGTIPVFISFSEGDDWSPETGRKCNWDGRTSVRQLWSVEYSGERGYRSSGDVPEELNEATMVECHRLVNEALTAAIENDSEVAAAVESYAEIVRSIKAEHEQHYAQWALDIIAIAKKFRRKFVQLGEQTVPGKVMVRSSRGRTLGYADCWDGRWLGTVERV